MNSSLKILQLESLRGIAALSVVLYHIPGRKDLNWPILDNSYLFVDFFFVLSGFVISLNYLDRIKSGNDLVQFQYKRFLRLYPLHIAMLFVFLGLEIGRYFIEILPDYPKNPGAFKANNYEAFLENIFLLQNWLSPKLTFNTPSWSISAEFFTYALFGAVFLFLRNKLFLTISILLIIGLAAVVLDIFGVKTDNFAGPARCVYSFAIGVFVMLIGRRLQIFGYVKSSIPGIIAMIMIMIMIMIAPTDRFDNILLLYPVAFGVFILMSAATNQNALFVRVLSFPILIYLGTLSFGIYMIHKAVWRALEMLSQLSYPNFGANFSGTTPGLFFENSLLGDSAFFIVGLTLSIALAHLSYHKLEKHFLTSNRKMLCFIPHDTSSKAPAAKN